MERRMAKYDVVGRVDSVANDTGCLRLKKEINARTQKWHPYPSYQHHAHPAEAKKKKKKKLSNACLNGVTKECADIEYTHR